MKYLDFEKKISADLSNAQESVDMDKLLSALDLVSTPKKRTYPLWVMIPIALLLGTTFVLGAMSLNSSNDQDVISETVTSHEGGIKLASSLSRDKADVIGDKRSIEEQKVKSTFKAETNIVAVESEAKESKNIAATKKIKEFQDQENDNNRTDQYISTSISNFKSKSIPNKRKPQLNTSSYPQKHQASMGDLVSYSLENDAKSTFANINSTTIEANSSVSNSMSTAYVNVNAKRTLETSMANLAMRTINIELLDRDVDGIFSRMKINCPKFNQAFWRLALIPELGMFAPMKTLESKTQELSPDFVVREGQEQSLEGINLGLYGMVVRDKIPFYLKAGISYSRISERLDLEYNYTVQDTAVGIISSTVSGNGDTITHVYGPVITETIFTGRNRKHYYIHLFDLPVSVGYSTYVGGFDIGLEAGVKVNLMTRATGNMLSSAADHTNLAFETKFKDRIGFSYFGGLMIGRNFGPFGDFYIAPRFQYYPNDFSNADNNISQKYVSIGINAGVVYNIGK